MGDKTPSQPWEGRTPPKLMEIEASTPIDVPGAILAPSPSEELGWSVLAGLRHIKKCSITASSVDVVPPLSPVVNHDSLDALDDHRLKPSRKQAEVQEWDESVAIARAGGHVDMDLGVAVAIEAQGVEETKNELGKFFKPIKRAATEYPGSALKAVSADPQVQEFGLDDTAVLTRKCSPCWCVCPGFKETGICRAYAAWGGLPLPKKPKKQG